MSTTQASKTRRQKECECGMWSIGRKYMEQCLHTGMELETVADKAQGNERSQWLVALLKK